MESVDETWSIVGGGGNVMVDVNVNTIHILHMGIEMYVLKRRLVTMKPVEQWVGLS